MVDSVGEQTLRSVHTTKLHTVDYGKMHINGTSEKFMH